MTTKLHEESTIVKRASFIRAQNFAAPSIKSTTNQLQHSDNTKLCRTNNIMFDSRVCRGNTYSNPVITEDQLRNRGIYEREQTSRRRLLERRRREKSSREGTPPPVKGRLHASTQTESTMDEIFGQKNVCFNINESGKEIPCHSSLAAHDGGRDERRTSFLDKIGGNGQFTSSEIIHKTPSWEDQAPHLDKRLIQHLTKIILEEATKNAIVRLDEDRRYYSDTECCA